MKPSRFVAHIFAIFILGLSGCTEDVPSFDPANGQSILDAAACGEEPTTCPGTQLPAVELENFQPQAPDFGELVSLDSYRGKPLVIALLAAW